LTEKEANLLIKKENKTIQEAVDLKKYYKKDEVKNKLSESEQTEIMQDLHKTISALTLSMNQLLNLKHDNNANK
jgi:hypothetical protein